MAGSNPPAPPATGGVAPMAFPRGIAAVWACLPGTLEEINFRLRSEQPKVSETSQRSRRVVDGFRRIGRTAVVEIIGPMERRRSWWSWLIGSVISEEVSASIREAVADSAVDEIALFIDSPGGQYAGTGDLAEVVFRARGQKRITAYLSDLGASAAYWVAAQADRVYANPEALVGSIGTYSVVADWSAFFEKEGIKVHLIRSGEFKGAGAFGTQITDAQLAEFQRIVDSINREFLKGVGRGRGLPMGRVRELADGRVHIAADAKGLGLIDGVRRFEDLLAELSRQVDRSVASRPSIAELRATCPGAEFGFIIACRRENLTLEEAKKRSTATCNPAESSGQYHYVRGSRRLGAKH